MEKTLSWVAVGVVGLAGLTSSAGCEKSEPPPPLPAATAAPQPPETVALVPDEEQPVDAGQDAEAPKRGVGKPRASFKACCDALQQNAASAPEPTATYMKQAAATCSALVASGQQGGTIIAAIRGALGGAPLPGPCR